MDRGHLRSVHRPDIGAEASQVPASRRGVKIFDGDKGIAGIVPHDFLVRRVDTDDDHPEWPHVQPVRYQADRHGLVQLGYEFTTIGDRINWSDSPLTQGPDREVIIHTENDDQLSISGNTIRDITASKNEGRLVSYTLEDNEELRPVRIGDAWGFGDKITGRIKKVEVMSKVINQRRDSLDGYKERGLDPFDRADKLLDEFSEERAERKVETYLELDDERNALFGRPYIRPGVRGLLDRARTYDYETKRHNVAKKLAFAKKLGSISLRKPMLHAGIKVQALMQKPYEYLADAQEGQKRRRRLAAMAGAALALGTTVTVGYLSMKGHESHHLLSNVNNPLGGMDIPTPKPHSVIPDVISAKPSGHTVHTQLHEVALHSGQNPWTVAEHQYHVHGNMHPTDAQIWDYDKRILKANHETVESARHFRIGKILRLPRLKVG